MSPQSFADWLTCFIEDSEVGNKPTVAQWQTILKRLNQVDTGKPADCMGYVGFIDPRDDPEDWDN